ncbi:MAG: hypothetical protein H7301_13935 [Cryobacterium sp.]|nr:hypothetical protein [Oligoflexia bacterium]
MKITFFKAMLVMGLSVNAGANSRISSPESGPIFHSRTAMQVDSYEKKENKKVSAMTPEEMESVGIFEADGAYVDADGAAVNPNSQRLVITPGKSFNGLATAGRYLYTGNVPKFPREALEMVVSKTALTLRVKAWVSEAQMAGYRFQSLYRWKKIYDKFQSASLSFVKLKDPEVVLTATKDAGIKNWLKVAMQYMSDGFADTGIKIYDHMSDTPADYKRTVLTAMLRLALGSDTLEIEDGLALYQTLSTSLEARIADSEISRDLFIKNLGGNLTNTNEKDGYVSFLTFVYPIAGSTKGAFDQPGEGVLKFGSGGTFMESRKWSDFWDAEFGGLPFMEVVNGVGFHGPITNKNGIDAWYLRRGYVSHGCFRMDASDVMELREILPERKAMLGKGVPISILSWPDVTDVKGDGTLEAMDVAYYDIPTSVTKKGVASYKIETAQKNYWRTHFTYLNGLLKNSATKERNSFDLETGTFKNIPKYEIIGKKLVKTGFHPLVKLHTFPARGSNVIQYRDAKVIYHDGDYEDNAGQNSMTYFNNLRFVEPKVAPVTEPKVAPVTEPKVAPNTGFNVTPATLPSTMPAALPKVAPLADTTRHSLLTPTSRSAPDSLRINR